MLNLTATQRKETIDRILAAPWLDYTPAELLGMDDERLAHVHDTAFPPTHDPDYI